MLWIFTFQCKQHILHSTTANFYVLNSNRFACIAIRDLIPTFSMRSFLSCALVSFSCWCRFFQSILLRLKTCKHGLVGDQIISFLLFFFKYKFPIIQNWYTFHSAQLILTPPVDTCKLKCWNEILSNAIHICLIIKMILTMFNDPSFQVHVSPVQLKNS